MQQDFRTRTLQTLRGGRDAIRARIVISSRQFPVGAGWTVNWGAARARGAARGGGATGGTVVRQATRAAAQWSHSFWGCGNGGDIFRWREGIARGMTICLLQARERGRHEVRFTIPRVFHVENYLKTDENFGLIMSKICILSDKVKHFTKGILNDILFCYWSPQTNVME